MSKVTKTPRISKELAIAIEKDAKIKRISENEWMNQAFEEKLKRKTLREEIPTLRPIITKYPAKCSKCTSQIDVGSPAYWNKGVIICMDCFVQSLGDKALSSKYLKMRELTKTLRALKSQCDHYADILLDHKYQIKFQALSNDIAGLISKADDYLRHIGEPQEKQLFHELIEFFKEVKKEWQELKAVVSAKIQPIRKRKKVTY